MSEKNTALAQARVNSVTQYFMSKVAEQVATLPDVIGSGEAKRLTANLVIRGNSALEENGKDWSKVDASKFMMDCVRMVTLGLDAGNNECYAIPYNNKETGKVELQCSPSAKGYQKLVLLYSVGKKIIDFSCFTIKEGDTFTVKRTPGNDIWTYEEDVFGSGQRKGYVTIVTFEDGTSKVMTHSLEDIEKRRKASKVPNGPAWTKWYDEMAQAKAIRRHATRISIKLPDGAEKALKEMEDQAAEQEMKDVTPETIALPEMENNSSETAQPQEEAPATVKAPENSGEQYAFPDESWMEG